MNATNYYDYSHNFESVCFTFSWGFYTLWLWRRDVGIGSPFILSQWYPEMPCSSSLAQEIGWWLYEHSGHIVKCYSFQLSQEKVLWFLKLSSPYHEKWHTGITSFLIHIIYFYKPWYRTRLKFNEMSSRKAEWKNFISSLSHFFFNVTVKKTEQGMSGLSCINTTSEDL